MPKPQEALEHLQISNPDLKGDIPMIEHCKLKSPQKLVPDDLSQLDW